METKVKFLILGISMLLGGFIVLLFLAHSIPTLVNFGAFAFIVGVLVTFGGFVEIATDKESLQTSKKKIIAVALIVITVGLAVPYSAWTIVVPNWSFSVSTDKTTYSFGEDVEITVTLRNMGFIAHSFKSVVSNAISLLVSNPSKGSYVWWNSSYLEDTALSLEPNQILQRNFVWNQTKIYKPEEEIELGEYKIEARLGSDWEHYLFWAKTYINITST